MNKLYSRSCLLLALALLIGAIFIVPDSAFAQGQITKSDEVGSTPIVTLQRWQAAEESERYSFLIGFVTMLEIEHAWQGDNPLPFKQSLIDCWVQGLQGMSYKELYVRINNYIAEHPNDLELPLPQVIWFDVVQPKVADKIRAEK